MNIPILSWIHPGKIASRAVDKVRLGGLIGSGPFSGFTASDEALRGNWPQLLGLYEIQLHGILEFLLQRRYPLIIDVGGASGYYAIGLALRQREAQLIVFESEPHLREMIGAYARRSGVESRMDIRGHCHHEELKRAIREEGEGLLVMDCEGGERELLGETLVQELAKWHILVELHDWHAPEAAGEIQQRFQKTHVIKEIWTRELKASDCNFLLSWPLTHYCLPYLRRLCTEGRGGPMRYFLMTPNSI